MPVTVATSFLVISLKSLVRSNSRHRDAALQFSRNRVEARAAIDESDGEDDTSPDSDSDSNSEEEESHLTTRSVPSSSGASTIAYSAPQNSPSSVMSSYHHTSSTPGASGTGGSGQNQNAGGGSTIDFSSRTTSSPSSTTTTTTAPPGRTLPYFSELTGSSFTASNGTVVPVNSDTSNPNDSSPASRLQLGNSAIVGITLGFVIFAGLMLLVGLHVCKRNRRLRKAPQGFTDPALTGLPSLFASQAPPPGFQPSANLFGQHHLHPTYQQHLAQQGQLPTHAGQAHLQGHPSGQTHGPDVAELPVGFVTRGLNRAGAYATTTTGSMTSGGGGDSSSPPPGGGGFGFGAASRSLSPFAALRRSTPSPSNGSLSTGNPPVPPGLGSPASGGHGYLNFFSTRRRRPSSRRTATSMSSHSSHHSKLARSLSQSQREMRERQGSDDGSHWPEADPRYLAMPMPALVEGVTPPGTATGDRRYSRDVEGDDAGLGRSSMDRRRSIRTRSYQNQDGGYHDGRGSRHGHGSTEGDDPPPSYGQAF